MDNISKLAKSLGDLVLRNVIIKTRADLRSRLDDVFKSFESSIDKIVERIEWMKTTDNWWWGYWNNNALRPAIEGNWLPNYHGIAKIILWKYENYLISEKGKSGYAPIKYTNFNFDEDGGLSASQPSSSQSFALPTQ